MASGPARVSYYFGARSKATTAAHQPLYVATSTTGVTQVERAAHTSGARLPNGRETSQSRDDFQYRVGAQPTVTAYSRSSSEAPSKTNYSFGARLPNRRETSQSRDDFQSRVDAQPTVTAYSRSSSEAPSKMNYSFGARLPNRRETSQSRDGLHLGSVTHSADDVLSSSESDDSFSARLVRGGYFDRRSLNRSKDSASGGEKSYRGPYFFGARSKPPTSSERKSAFPRLQTENTDSDGSSSKRNSYRSANLIRV